MKEGPLGGTIPPGALRGSLRLTDVEALLRAHGVLIRSVDNHHWQISRGDRSGLWMLGEAPIQTGSGLDPAALTRLQLVLRQTGLLREVGGAASVPTPMGAAILWVGQEATRVYWINDQGLSDASTLSLGRWLHGEITLHRDQRTVPYVRRIVAMLERIERALLVGQLSSITKVVDSLAGASEDESDESLLHLTHLLEQERPDLRERGVGVLSLEADKLDDATLFAIARDYLLPHSRAPQRSSSPEP
ncbi:MAG: hypothetical protein NTW51_13170 [Cyanobacteria bacterium]|nr:hypothetical protein [Cyanobacteriota bacterium]